MSINLVSILKGAAAIPYSEALIEVLDTACRSYLSDYEFDRVDELVRAFVTGRISHQFRECIINAITLEGFDEVPTEEVFVRLAQYVVLLTIAENDDELNQSICASKLMNYMLVTKALKRQVPNMNDVLNAYKFHLSNYIAKIDKLNDVEDSGLRSSVPEADFPLTVNNENEQELKLVFKEAELFRIERLINSDEIQRIENPYVRVFIGLHSMFEQLPYCFYNLDLKHIIAILGKGEKSRKKLATVISDIRNAGYVFQLKYSATSVLLAMIDGAHNKEVEDLTLPIKEFAVYLYYEFLTEKIIDSQD